jgi:hypothetical protein
MGVKETLFHILFFLARRRKFSRISCQELPHQDTVLADKEQLLLFALFPDKRHISIIA